jgi:hypothetical protein
MKDKKDLRVCVIPNAIIKKNFTMRNVGGDYRIMDNRTSNIIYNDGKCFNCGSIDIDIDGVIAGLAIRSIAYVLRWDNADCDYHMFNIVTPNGYTPEEKSKHLKYFNVADIKCYSRGRVEWKNLPRVKDVQWSVKENKQIPSIKPEQTVMNLESTKTVIRQDVVDLCNGSRLWDVEVNGTIFSFKSKEAMIEMCKSMANK